MPAVLWAQETLSQDQLRESLQAVFENKQAAEANAKEVRDLKAKIERLEAAAESARENAIVLRTLQAELETLRAERVTRPLNLSNATDESTASFRDAFDAPILTTLPSPSLPGDGSATALWLFVSALCIFLMIIGFAVREVGLSHARNGVNAVMKSLLTLSIGMAAFVFVGFPLMFGVRFDWIFQLPADSPAWSFWLVQTGFVVLAACICSGATGERTRFGNYLLVMLIFTAVVYPLLAQFAWGSRGARFGIESAPGWLENLGFIDFGGSAVIHGIGGAFALAGIKVLGPRTDRFSREGVPKIVTGHSLPLAAIGTLLVWLGWFGLGLGQAIASGIHLNLIGHISVNLAIAAAGGSVFASLSIWKHRGKSDLNFALNGILAGLVAISSCADQASPLTALLIGGAAGLLATWGFVLLEHRGLDDVVGAVPVHLYAGIWGTLAASLRLDGFSVQALLNQALGIVALCGLAYLIGILLFKAVEIGLGLRASDEDQAAGLDFSEHSTTAYPEFDLQES